VIREGFKRSVRRSYKILRFDTPFRGEEIDKKAVWDMMGETTMSYSG